MAGAKKEVKVVLKGENAAGPAFKAVRKEAEAFRDSVKDLLNPINLLKGAIAGLGIAALGDFFKKTVELAADSGASMQRLSTQLANAGITSRLASNEVNELSDALQSTTRFDNDAIRDAFTELLSITNDYGKSTKDLGLVLDVAVAKQLDLSTASQLVGRAAIGDTALLKRYGIVVKQGGDAIAEMSDRFRNAAQNDGKTFQGRIEQLKHAAEDLLKDIGFVITGQQDLAGATNVVTQALGNMGKWVQEHRGELQGYIGDLATAVKLLGKVVAFALPKRNGLGLLSKTGDALGETAANAAGYRPGEDAGNYGYYKALGDIRARQERQIEESNARAAAEAAKAKAVEDEKARKDAIDKQVKAIGDETASLLAQSDLLHRSVEQTRELEALATKLRAIRDDETQAMQVQLAAAKAVADIEQNKAFANAQKFAKINTSTAGLKVTAASSAPGQIQQISEKPRSALTDLAQMHDQGFASKFSLDLSEAAKQMGYLDDATSNFSDTMSQLAAGGVGGFSRAFGAAMAGMITGSKSAAKGFESAMGSAIAAVAEKKGEFYAAESLAAWAKVAGGNFAAVGEALKWMAAAAAMFAIAGAGGGIGAGGGGGGSASTAQQQASQTLNNVGQSTLTISFAGGRSIIDLNNPDDQDAFAQMLQKLQGTRVTTINFGISATG